jgi:hypothetical protein
MNRRGFLGKLVGGIAAGAAVRTFPFRVFSFPSDIVRPPFRIPILTSKYFPPHWGGNPIMDIGLPELLKDLPAWITVKHPVRFDPRTAS